MTAAICQALPSFYSDYRRKLLLISVSSDFYEKYIVTLDYCVSTHNSFCSLENCEFHLVLIGISLSQTFQKLDKYVYIIKKMTVFTLCLNTDSIQVLLRQVEKCSISLVEQFNATYDGKKPKRCLVLQRND